MVGHGAFPGHPGNQNLGHPRKDCIYFLYSDIYVSPSGSDSTGQGTAGRPYRTLQKCIDASLAGSRDYYVYKRADGGDRDPAIPDGTPRYGIESAFATTTSAGRVGGRPPPADFTAAGAGATTPGTPRRASDTPSTGTGAC